jgi:hypothetical protein
MTERVVSHRAQSGLDHFVAQAARGAMAASASACEVKVGDDSVAGGPEVVMLTVSSYVFRMLMFVQFDRDTATRAHFAALADVPLDVMVGERFVDAVMERGNLCCGALNRDLAPFFPHIGMSTPCTLDRSCLEHVASLHPAFTRRYRVEPSPGVALYFTLAVCAFADIDFPFEPRAVVEETAGELEMF